MFNNIRVLEFITSLNTAAKQTLAILLILLSGSLGVNGYLFKELRNTEKEKDAQRAKEILDIKKEHSEEISVLRIQISELQQSVATCKMDAYNFLNELYVEQKRLNGENRQVTKTQLELAERNKRYVNSIKKDAKQLSEVLKQK